MNNGDDEDFDKIMEEEEGEFQIDSELYELRRKFMELKEERKKTVKDALLLENKLKLLQTEETKSFKKSEKERRTQEETDLIRTKLNEEKERLENLKLEQENELKSKQQLISQIRDNVQNTVKNWKDNLKEKNKTENQRFKLIRDENEKYINMQKQDMEEKNKQTCIQIKNSVLTFNEKKKKLDVNIY